jgi:hypothetical protein
MALILLLLLLSSGGLTYYNYRKTGKFNRMVPVMLVILMICLLVGRSHPH